MFRLTLDSEKSSSRMAALTNNDRHSNGFWKFLYLRGQPYILYVCGTLQFLVYR